MADAAEPEALYGLLEREVVLDFYTRDEHGIPRRWVARMRESMARLTPAFSADRAVRQYSERHYLPAAAAFRRRAEQQGRLGADVFSWQTELTKRWAALRFGSATVERQGEHYLFQVQVFLDSVDPDAVRVELFAEGLDNSGPVREPLDRGERPAASTDGFLYTARIPAARPAADYTPRLIPQHREAFVPLEAPLILWHDSPSWR